MYNLDYVSEKNRIGFQENVILDYCSSKTLRVLEIPDGMIVSGSSGCPGVFTQTSYLEESNFHNGFGAPEKNLPKDPETSEEEIVFIGSFSGIWGHCITDNLKHLWILLDPHHPLLKLKLAYVMQNDEESLPDSFLKLIELLGVPRNSLIRIRGTKQFRKVYLPEQCFFCKPGGDLFQSGKRYFTTEYAELISRIRENIPSVDAPEKIYFSRTALQDPRDSGEKSIEEVFRKSGFEIIFPERLDVFAQISLLKGCKTFAATQGSVSLNAVFCSSEAEVILIDKQNYCSPYQLTVNQVRRGTTTIISANRSVLNPPATPWVGPFFLYKSRELCRWAHIPYHGFPLFSFLGYLCKGRKR